MNDPCSSQQGLLDSWMRSEHKVVLSRGAVKPANMDCHRPRLAYP
jgi:hypothetical protein